MAPIRSKKNTREPQGGLVTRQRRAPISRGVFTQNMAPSLSGVGSKLVVSHCEPFLAVNWTAAGVLNYATAPIIPASMPYLNGIAANFGKFTWKKLILYYTPSCPTTADGELAMGLYYDRQDAAAASFVQVSSMSCGVTSPPWGGGTISGPGSVSMRVDCNRFDKARYSYQTTATFGGQSLSDQNQYCPVSLARATQGNTVGGAILGRIWCCYTVELIDPIIAGINA